MQIHNLPAQTTAANADALAIDNGSTTQKITTANLGKKITEDATPAYTSNDIADSSATYQTGWTTVAKLASGDAVKTTFNKLSTMMKNLRWLYKFIGTTDISSLSDAHTVTGALAKLNTDITVPKTFTPHLYDSNTKIRDLTENSGTYYKFGNIYIMVVRMTDPDLSGINAMMIFKNFPCKYVYGGSIYIGGLASYAVGAGITFQSTTTYYAIYPRPNVKSSDFTDPTKPGIVTIFAVGSD